MNKILVLILFGIIFLNNYSYSKEYAPIKEPIKNNLLPKNFNGIDLHELDKIFLKDQFLPYKDEFEKEKDFQSRLNSFPEKNLFSNIKFSENVYIKGIISKQSNDFSYDAETGVFTITINVLDKNGNITPNSELKSIFLDVITKDLGQRNIYKGFYLKLINQDNFLIENDSLSFQIKIDALKAKKIKSLYYDDNNSLNFLFYGNLEKPYYDFKFVSDTNDDIGPVFLDHFIFFNLKKIILFNQKTGEILYTLNI